MKLLAINTYAGSLLIGAKWANSEVVGSYEDDGFGQKVARLNFPHLHHVETRPEWPNRSLRGTLVIAHPPCAAFSNQNNVAAQRGVDTAAFKCHKWVMDYALGAGAKAVAIESVPGAMSAAREIHDEYGKKYGYNVFRILQNACTFGLPQWRPRFWVIFMKKDEFDVFFHPVYKCVEEILMPHGTVIRPSREVEAVFKRLEAKGFTRKEVTRWLENHTGGFLKVAANELGIKVKGPNGDNVRKATNLKGMFGCYMPRSLDTTAFAPTVLLDSTWYAHGRPLFQEEYQRIMGFPDEYQWGDEINKFRMYLSKGVCPPVARWIIGLMENNAEGRDQHCNYVIQPGEVLDLSPTKKEALAKARQIKLNYA